MSSPAQRRMLSACAAWEGRRMRRFASLRAFYPFYLSEHRHPLYAFAGD
ncbi:hypothetical protein [Xanthomonas translucens]|nr:hypothetical protein [Xanthomonas translucens]MBC3973030.1 hypothetical protein [Xanthomonas translucens pv. undulosa]MCS3358664.1 DUF962 domain-containing protein [Xanthomonas translucens pv. translucens]MCT8283842.1 DUF962 domain-containing protein [Xanthomonas translucens pv. undulosa]MCT8287352.1 DUF962 domain-containing protein [Xanthomonas translucens pv. translucens]MCT8290399.1 DUF962 domain-containing protein [Xanthomonas translucens pv. translucens]